MALLLQRRRTWRTRWLWKSEMDRLGYKLREFSLLRGCAKIWIGNFLPKQPANINP
jgi:hypothetical protein